MPSPSITSAQESAAQDAADRAYNPRLYIADMDARIQTMHARSQTLLARAHVMQTVAYGASPAEYLDIFLADAPSDAALAPVVVFIPGGFWRSLSVKYYAFLAEHLQQSGATCVFVNYGLCPDISIDAIVFQCRLALAWIYRNIASHGGDARRLHVIGHSAGGHLAAMLALPDWPPSLGLEQNPIRSACAISGLFDLAPLAHSWLQSSLKLDAGVIARNSPLRLDATPACPVLLAFGAAESAGFRRQSTDYAAHLQKAGADADLLEISGRDHINVLDDLAPGQTLFLSLRALHAR